MMLNENEQAFKIKHKRTQSNPPKFKSIHKFILLLNKIKRSFCLNNKNPLDSHTTYFKVDDVCTNAGSLSLVQVLAWLTLTVLQITQNKTVYLSFRDNVAQEQQSNN